jgi:hypothetical protein
MWAGRGIAPYFCVFEDVIFRAEGIFLWRGRDARGTAGKMPALL